MLLTDLIIDADAMLIGSKLIKVTPYYSYANGTKTDRIIGYRYTVVLPAVSFEKLEIRIDGNKQIETPEEPLNVTFDEPNIRIYFFNKKFDITASAKNIHVE